MQQDWSCPACTFNNPGSSDTCSMCGTAKPSHQQQNQHDNIFREYELKRIAQDNLKYQQSQRAIRASNPNYGLPSPPPSRSPSPSLSSQSDTEPLTPSQASQLLICPICAKETLHKDLKSHYTLCIQELHHKLASKQNTTKSTWDLQSAPQYFSSQIDCFNRCTKSQGEALMHLFQACRPLHHQALPQLDAKYQQLGYPMDDIYKVSYFLQNQVRLVIHFSLKRDIDFFLKDSHYRNRFETSKDMGYRVMKENTLFGHKYQDAEPFQRVKYGVINISNDPYGVALACSYGPSYLLLKRDLHKRCSFTNGNSFQKSPVGTLDFNAHIISQFSDDDLRMLMNAAKGVKGGEKYQQYKEIQIHGPIEFAKDIERVYVWKGEVEGNEGLRKKLELWSKRCGVKYEVMEVGGDRAKEYGYGGAGRFGVPPAAVVRPVVVPQVVPIVQTTGGLGSRIMNTVKRLWGSSELEKEEEEEEEGEEGSSRNKEKEEDKKESK